MVCPVESGKMTTLARLLDAGSFSHTLTGEGGHQKLAAQYLRRELQEADEANMLDEEDMHIFGLRPMTDPLDLVCCNACKKPIKASQYAAHAELCKSISAKADFSLEHEGPTVNRKPPRKERKKSLITQTKKASSFKEPKGLKALNSEDTAASDSHVNKKIQMTHSPETKTRNMRASSKHKTNGSRVSPSDVDCSQDVPKCSSKPLKRSATESPSKPVAKNMCLTSIEIPPRVTFSDAPAPLATKIYYSHRNNHLRRAICHMFFDESSKESCSEVSNLDILRNAVPTQNSTPSDFYHEQVENPRSDEHFLHRVQTQDQVVAESSEFNRSKPGGFVPSMNVASQLPMKTPLEPHYLSNSYSFASEPGNCLGTVQQGSGSVPVV